MEQLLSIAVKNRKSIAIIAGIILFVSIVIVLPLKPGDVPPAIIDEGKVTEFSSMAIESVASDIPIIKETSTSKSLVEEGLKIYTSENGTKQIFLSAIDQPKAKEP